MKQMQILGVVIAAKVQGMTIIWLTWQCFSCCRREYPGREYWILLLAGALTLGSYYTLYKQLKKWL